LLSARQLRPHLSRSVSLMPMALTTIRPRHARTHPPYRHPCLGR
jgi:hypothetical protein